MADWGKIFSRGNVEDRRGNGLALGGGLGVVGVIVTLLYTFLSGGTLDLNQVLGSLNGLTDQQNSLTSSDFEGADNYEVFASTVLGSTNDYWTQKVTNYQGPKLVLFRSATASGCGLATSDVGPHYCPADKTIYLDETFFQELQQRFKAKGGDVAEAYVIAHEVGHHVQNITGTMDQIAHDNTQANSIALELQADCYAGSWANSVSTLGVFEPGEINEAVDAAAAVGDDRIQQSVTGQMSPETWTHGSSEQRVQWFNAGYNSGNPTACNTFADL
ncbi:MAG: uncharacterized protein JWN33_497 [Candidatus Saccharibacteria bacterium]|nr:uncharacterized protein [Candidatus Saccharibacteria bacterium]